MSSTDPLPRHDAPRTKLGDALQAVDAAHLALTATPAGPALARRAQRAGGQGPPRCRRWPRPGGMDRVDAEGEIERWLR